MGWAESGKPPWPSSTRTDTGTTLDALRRGEPYRRWLLVFDNADKPEDIAASIPGGPGDVVITSRNNRWAATVETVEVNVFSRYESTEFLTRRVSTNITESDASPLAQELGDLPLALEQAGALQAATPGTLGVRSRLGCFLYRDPCLSLSPFFWWRRLGAGMALARVSRRG